MSYSKNLIEFVDSISHLKCFAVIKNKKRKYYEKYLLLELETNFLSDSATVKDRIYYVKNNLKEILRCPICDLETGIHHGRNSAKFCSTKCSKKRINPITNKSIASEASHKGAKTKANTYINGVPNNIIINEKIKKSFNIIEANGKTKKSNLSIKISNTRNLVNPKTGLTNAQESGKKTSITKNLVNPKTGLTNAQESGKKTSITLKNKSYIKLLKLCESNDVELLSTFESWRTSTYINYKCSNCNTIRASYYSYIRCLKCYPYSKSAAQTEIYNFCNNLINDIILENNREIIKPNEIDVYIEKYKFGIEYDGLYWHSSDSVESENKNYHLHKTQECEKQGIHLFHIFENEWLDHQKQIIWKSIIKNKLGKSDRIYARKTEVRSVSSKDKTEFLNSNHLQGNCGSSVNLGLYLGDELVSLMTFGKSRYDKKVDWELIRFCNKIGYSIVGGASRLLKTFQRENDGSIISYADKRRSNGNLYKQLGFEFSHDSKPNYYYFQNHIKKLESRLGYQKHKLKDKLKIFDSNLNESENMYVNGYRKIYDCGNQVWIINK